MLSTTAKILGIITKLEKDFMNHPIAGQKILRSGKKISHPFPQFEILSYFTSTLKHFQQSIGNLRISCNLSKLKRYVYKSPCKTIYEKELNSKLKSPKAEE